MNARAARTLVALLGIALAAGASLAAAAPPSRATRPASLDPKERGRFVRAGAVSLYLEERGAGGARPLLVVNGGPGFGHDYVHCSAIWDELAKRRRVAFYDQRGTGRSTPWKSGLSCTLADQIADLDAIRAALGAAKLDLLGHSWGGYLVMAYAARHPEHIAHLVIVDSAAPKWSETEFLFKSVFPEGMERQQALQFSEALGDAAALKQDLREYFAMLFYDPANRDRFLALGDLAFSNDVNRAVSADLERFDLNPELAKFRFPALVITGRYDMNVSPATAWKIHQRIPGSAFAVFEKSGHFPYFEEPDRFASTLEEFLAR